jgi:Cys-rich repeat protein
MMKKRGLFAAAAVVLTLLVIVVLWRERQAKKCASDSDCPSGQSCQAGQCGQKSGCQKDSDCTAGYFCGDDGKCVLPNPDPGACNQWRQYKDFSAPPSWAWSPNPDFPDNNNWQPGVADRGGVTPPCFGGVSTMGAGKLYGARCSGPNAPHGIILPTDANMFLIERNPDCGPLKYTTEPAKALRYDDTPVCFSQKNPYGDGVLTGYDEKNGACRRTDYGAGDQILIANDAVPQAALRSRAYHGTGPRF